MVGSAPLTVTFTATCTSATYAWSFGDGEEGLGASVQHVYGAGAFHPTLTSDAGAEAAPVVTAISLKVTGPKVARYAQRVTLHASVIPRVPVTLRGRHFVNGKLRIRILGTAPWTAQALGVRAAPVRIAVIPKLTLRTIGQPGRRRPRTCRRHAAPRERRHGRRAAARRHAHGARRARSAALAAGQGLAVSAAAATSISVVQPNLSLGARGASVRELERRLAELHYAIKRDGYFGSEDLEAVYAFQKVERLARTGSVDATLWARIVAAHAPLARYGGDHVEIDKTRQVLFIVRGGKVTLTVATSTGATGNTPLGTWHVYRKVGGFDWVLYYPSYFLRGFAVHGYPDVPPYPASHGCARIPMWIAQTVYAQIGYGSTVYVYQ